MQYIKDITKFTFTTEANDNPNWWVTSSYAIHPDMQIHAGIYMKIGK